MDYDTSDKNIKANRDAIIYVIAHEFAHVFLIRQAHLAKETLHKRMSESSAKKERVLSEDECKSFSAMGVFGGMDPLLYCMFTKPENIAPMHERMADATAIAWGFGREYAMRLCDGWGGAPSYEDVCENPSNCLDREILTIHETLLAAE